MSMQSIHEERGARWSEENGVRVVRNYGDPAAEYDAARSACIVAERTERSVLRVYGRDPIRMVQGLVTNDLTRASETRAVYAAVLTPKGKMVADVRVLRHGVELLIEVDAHAREALVAHLRKYVPPLFARFESADESWAVLTVGGPHARTCVSDALDAGLDGVTQEDDVATAMPDGGTAFVIATSQFDEDGLDIVVDRAQVAPLWERLVEAGARPAGHATLEVLRVEAGRPRWGRELDESRIPLEAGLRERAISETKGCYTGQEVIIRILHRGHVNRVLRGLLLGDTPAPTHGAALVRAEDGKEVGRITSSVWSPKHGQTIALGYVRREIDAGGTVRLGETSGPQVRVVALPFAEGVGRGTRTTE